MGQKGNGWLQRGREIRTIECHELERETQGSSRPALGPAQDNLKNLTRCHEKNWKRETGSVIGHDRK